MCLISLLVHQEFSDDTSGSNGFSKESRKVHLTASSTVCINNSVWCVYTSLLPGLPSPPSHSSPRCCKDAHGRQYITALFGLIQQTGFTALIVNCLDGGMSAVELQMATVRID